MSRRKNFLRRILLWFKKPSKKIQEYIYIDHDRLSTYSDQLRSPVTYTKTPMTSFEANISGPTIKSGYNTISRIYTIPEQILFLIKTLKETEQLKEERWDGKKIESELLTFRIETCLAVKVIVSDPNSNDKLIIWISRYDPEGKTVAPKILLLLENLKTPDKNAEYASSYSWLYILLLKSAPKFLTLKILHDKIMMNNIQELSENLLRNPVGFFKILGGEVLPERCIQTLYRVRDACVTRSNSSYPTAVTIGYPIFITQTSIENLTCTQKLYSNKDVSVQISNKRLNQGWEFIREMLKEDGKSDAEIEIVFQKLKGK